MIGKINTKDFNEGRNINIANPPIIYPGTKIYVKENMHATSIPINLSMDFAIIAQRFNTTK